MFRQNKLNCKVEKLPQGVRVMVYAYICFTDLKNKICKLSKTDRTNLINRKFQKEKLVQLRHIIVKVGEVQPKTQIDELRY